MATNLASEWEELVKSSAQNIKNYNPNETINMQDSRLTTIENQRGQDITNTQNEYNQMINNTDQFYQNQINAAQAAAQSQAEAQAKSTEQQVKEINQQREKTERDYQKEQRGAYTDYQKQVNEYGVNAEVMAARGLANTGYSESSQVSMYNAYQNRVATARQALSDSQQNYDNLVAQARLNNDTKQAEIAAQLAKQQAEYALQGFQYKNTLIESRQQQLNQLNSRYDARYNTMLNLMQNEIEGRRQNFQANVNILTQAEKNRQWAAEFDEGNRRFEAEMAQKQRQYDRELALQREQLAFNRQKWQQEYALERQRLQASIQQQRGVGDGSSPKIRLDTNKIKEDMKKVTNYANPNNLELKWEGGFLGLGQHVSMVDKVTHKKYTENNLDELYKDYGIANI